jgi:hypothetical protein
MSVRTVRIATALAVIGLSGWAMSCGWSIVHFAYAKASVVSHESGAGALRPWAAVPGVAVAALQASLQDVADPADVAAIRRRRDDFAAILSVRPMASMGWLSLASLRLMSGQSFDNVLGPLALSSLTGANEGQAVSQRGLFGLWQWEHLPARMRQVAVAGLAPAMLQRAISDDQRSTAARILSTKSADTCREIAELLRAEGLSTADLGRIGL